MFSAPKAQEQHEIHSPFAITSDSTSVSSFHTLFILFHIPCPPIFFFFRVRIIRARVAWEIFRAAKRNSINTKNVHTLNFVLMNKEERCEKREEKSMSIHRAYEQKANYYWTWYSCLRTTVWYMYIRWHVWNNKVINWYGIHYGAANLCDDAMCTRHHRYKMASKTARWIHFRGGGHRICVAILAAKSVFVCIKKQTFS